MIIQPGVTTADLNAAAEEVLKKHGVYSPFKNYPGPYPYPASTCVSVNEELVHGIPGKRKLKEGDIVSVDCGTVFEGFVGDSAFTAGVGEISKRAQKMLDVTEKALAIGIEQMVPGKYTGDIGSAIQLCGAEPDAGCARIHRTWGWQGDARRTAGSQLRFPGRGCCCGQG